jgi:hypothetical protein
MVKEFLKFSIAAMFSVFLGSHVMYLYFEPMKDFDKYVKEAEQRYKLKEAK